MARRNFASNNCKGTFSYRKSNKKWTRVKRMIVVLTTTGKLPYFCDDKCRNFTIHCSSTAALLLYMMDHYQSRWQWRRQSPWQNIGGIRALVLLLGCKKCADTQLRASSSSWRIPSSVAFIENQYEDFAGIKTDGSKPNIMRPVPKGGASGSTVFDLSHLLHGHSAIFPE